MAVGTVMVPQYTCERCGYQWTGRSVDSDLPTTCANQGSVDPYRKACRSPNWDRPRKKNLLGQEIGSTHTSQLSGVDHNADTSN